MNPETRTLIRVTIEDLALLNVSHKETRLNHVLSGLKTQCSWLKQAKARA